jgi:hypothetical protein
LEQPQGIARHNYRFVLLQVDSVADELATRWCFQPEVIFEPSGMISLWLPELALFGRGSSVEEAKADLLEEMRIYAEDWRDHLRDAPNHRVRAGWVRRIELAEDDEALARLLDHEPIAAS